MRINLLFRSHLELMVWLLVVDTVSQNKFYSFTKVRHKKVEAHLRINVSASFTHWGHSENKEKSFQINTAFRIACGFSKLLNHCYSAFYLYIVVCLQLSLLYWIVFTVLFCSAGLLLFIVLVCSCLQSQRTATEVEKAMRSLNHRD